MAPVLKNNNSTGVWACSFQMYLRSWCLMIFTCVMSASLRQIKSTLFINIAIYVLYFPS